MKIPFCVGIADAFDDRAQRCGVIGVFPIFDPCTDQIAEDAAEILMPGIAEKAPGVREHAHKAREIAVGGECFQLVDHPAPVVVEPPRAALLDL